MIKILPLQVEDNKIEPYFEVTINYMIYDDSNRYVQENREFPEDEFEKYVPFVLMLKKLKRLKDHWGICFKNYPKEYPGEYIGLTEKEYSEFYRFINSEEGEEFGIASGTEYYFLVFDWIIVTYVDENGAIHGVELE